MLKQPINSSIFRAYDIRGVFNETLTENSVYWLGKAIGSLVIEKGEKRIAIARDGRLSGPALIEMLRQGLMSVGCDVVDLGIVPTPLLYFATYELDVRSGIMLTGSHNPAEYNGLKMVISGGTLTEQGIQALHQRIIDGNFSEGQGSYEQVDIVERYLARATRDMKFSRKLKVVIDCGNGVTGNIAPKLFRLLGCEVHELFCEIDGRFPNHHPDPSVAENLQDLIREVKNTGADIGLAFDGDGDRLGVVTQNGEIIFPDRQLMLFAKSILQRNPGAKIIYDVKCTNHLAKVIQENGGEPIMWKTGHSMIKSKLAETGALLAGEMSGHIFFKENWYGFDDALYSGVRLLEILHESSLTSDGLFSEIPDSVNTPELKVFVSDTEKFSVMDKLIQQAHFAHAEEINTIDGLRVSFKNGWGLVRPSNTTPCLVLRFEADDENVLAQIKNIFRDVLLNVKPDLVLPF